MADAGNRILTGKIRTDKQFLSGKFPLEEEKLNGNLPGTLVIHTIGDLPRYEGACVVTPARRDQTLPTAGKYLTEDIRVEKIPERYGLITYNQDKTITIT